MNVFFRHKLLDDVWFECRDISMNARCDHHHPKHVSNDCIWHRQILSTFLVLPWQYWVNCGYPGTPDMIGPFVAEYLYFKTILCTYAYILLQRFYSLKVVRVKCLENIICFLWSPNVFSLTMSGRFRRHGRTSIPIVESSSDPDFASGITLIMHEHSSHQVASKKRVVLLSSLRQHGEFDHIIVLMSAYESISYV